MKDIYTIGDTILLHANEYTLGNKVLSLGLDMQCNKCVCVGRIIEINLNENYFIAESDIEGEAPCKMRCRIVDINYEGRILNFLNDYEVYSEDERARMDARCRNYNETFKRG